MGQAAPLVHDVGIDAVRQSHAGYRSTRPSALGQDLLLEFGAVAPPGLVHGFGHGVHLSRLVDTIVAAYVVEFKGGMAARLLSFPGMFPGYGLAVSAFPCSSLLRRSVFPQ